jgi:cephalosporin-C deacetylase-like acetyl esterase
MIAVAVLLALQSEDFAVFRPEDQPRKMLYTYLQAECGKKFEERRKQVAALKTPEDVERRQLALRASFVQALGGYPQKTPLNPKVVGTLKGEGFRVEKVIYESRPDHHVTANFYIPEGKGPFPGVLVPCGHSDNGKASDAYQRVCILMAKNGLAVLCYDPIGQGERMQLLSADGKPAIKGSTTEHTYTGISAYLVGWSCATFRIWDGIRSIDYLESRPEVDPKRLGCTGNSGGGTLTAYLMALDDRIAAAAPSCYVTTLERLFATIGPQDAEQNITGQVAFGMEQTDYVSMRAPKPTLMCTATLDFFDIQGCWTTFREAKKIYGMFGHAERMDLIEYNDKHGFSKPRREAAMRWMRRWLLGADDAPVEGDFPLFKDAELQCTETGQVLSALKGKSVFDLTRACAEFHAKYDPPKPAQANDGPVPTLKVAARTGALEKGWIEVEPGLRIPYRRYAVEEKDAPRVVVIGGDLPRIQPVAGMTMISLDLPGFGETTPEAKSPFGADWKEAFLAIHLNRPLLFERAAILRAAIRALGAPCRVVASGPAVPAALFAASQGDLISELTLDGGVISWQSVLGTPMTTTSLSNAPPNALKNGDLPAVAVRIAPRKLTIKAPVDGAGRPVAQGDLEAEYALVRRAYNDAGAEQNLLLQGAP